MMGFAQLSSHTAIGESMNLGQFSVSLAVKDISASLEFYQNLGFEVIDGGHAHMDDAFADTETHKWRILKNESAAIGLFQGMFEGNILTFNPEDLRPIQKSLKESGVEFVSEADIDTTGPCSAVLTDPDGNTILLDQHY
jgi:catechol 2,3-dioxygenase-like lactoylglutathione lyase family enzyme